MDAIEYIDSICANLDKALVEITAYGKGRKLKTHRPENGTYNYIWRMACFHSGINTRFPVVCTFYLSIEIEKQTGEKYLFAILDDKQKAILDKLDKFVDKVIAHIGIDEFGAVKAHKGLLY